MSEDKVTREAIRELRVQVEKIVRENPKISLSKNRKESDTSAVR